jgi:hypothetical protein
MKMCAAVIFLTWSSFPSILELSISVGSAVGQSSWQGHIFLLLCLFLFWHIFPNTSDPSFRFESWVLDARITNKRATVRCTSTALLCLRPLLDNINCFNIQSLFSSPATSTSLFPICFFHPSVIITSISTYHCYT